MTKLTVAALQLAFTDDTGANISAVSDLVREAAGKGAEVVLPPELFEGPYFCRVEDESLFATARPWPPISASGSRRAISSSTARTTITRWP